MAKNSAPKITNRAPELKKAKILVDINTDYNRPSETDHLLGDASKAKRDLNWKPKTNFEELVEMMVKKDLSRVENNSYSF